MIYQLYLNIARKQRRKKNNLLKAVNFLSLKSSESDIISQSLTLLIGKRDIMIVKLEGYFWGLKQGTTCEMLI